MRHSNRLHSLGFTLIEIIAVLVIIGILAAVAIPKYIDFQNSAEFQTNKAGIANLLSAANMTYSKYLLDNNGLQPAYNDLVTILNTAGNCGLAAGTSYTVTCGAGGLGMTFSATLTGGNNANSATGTWTMP